MIDLFDADEIVASRTHTQYEFSAHGRIVARTRNRPAAAGHWWTYALRLLGSSSATRHTEIEVCDDAGSPQWQIALEPGDPNTYAADVSLPDGSSIGRVSADGGLIRPFPRIHLVGPAGEPLGHATSAGAPQVFDTSDRLIADVTWLGARRPFDKPRFVLRFVAPEISAELRAVIVTAIIAWELPR